MNPRKIDVFLKRAPINPNKNTIVNYNLLSFTTFY